MGIPDRLYKLAKSYLDSAKTRWDEVDAAAQQELDAATSSSPALSAWERAQAKINNATSSNTASASLQPPPQPQRPPTAQVFAEEPQLPDTAKQPQQQPSTNALAAAYKVLDVPPGSNLATVQAAYRDLQKKADPTRFPDGSKDQRLAQDILRRVNSAYMMLANSLSGTNDDRFDRLEL